MFRLWILHKHLSYVVYKILWCVFCESWATSVGLAEKLFKLQMSIVNERYFKIQKANCKQKISMGNYYLSPSLIVFSSSPGTVKFHPRKFQPRKFHLLQASRPYGCAVFLCVFSYSTWPFCFHSEELLPCLHSLEEIRINSTD